MTTNESNVMARLKAARTAVAKAMIALDAKREPDVRAVEQQVDLAAAAATSLDQSATKLARPALLNLVADLNALHARIKHEHKAAAEALGEFSVQRRAVSAYARQPGA